jgi:hypothetical protein
MRSSQSATLLMNRKEIYSGSREESFRRADLQGVFKRQAAFGRGGPGCF